MTDNFFQKAFVIFCLAVIITMFGVVLNKAMALPDVHFSYETGNCVKVVNYNQDDNYSCENLPTRFYHVWEQ